MSQPQTVYKKYTNQIKHNTVILLKQQQLIQSSFKSEKKMQEVGRSGMLNEQILFKSSEEKCLQPLVLKKFEEYFRRSMEPVRNVKILNKIMHQQPKTKKISSRIPISSRQLKKLMSKDHKFNQTTITSKQRKQTAYSSKSRYQRLNMTQIKKPSLQQQSMKVEDFPITPPFEAQSTIPIHIRSTRKRQRLDNSIDLSAILSKTFTENGTKMFVGNQIMHNLVKKDEETNDGVGYLKIQSSVLVDRKALQIEEQQKRSKQQQLKKAIRSKLVSRKRALQQTFTQKFRSRSPSPLRYPRHTNFLTFLNPLARPEFTLNDLFRVILQNNKIDEVKMNMNGCFFSVYVQEGNNSELIKAIVRGVSGWRVVEILEVANFVWTQTYRRNLVEKKPRQIVRDQVKENAEQTQRSRERLSPKGNVTNTSFLLARGLTRKNSNSTQYLRRKSSQRLQAPQRQSPKQNYPELSLSKHQTSHCQQSSYQWQVRKLLPSDFPFQNYLIKPLSNIKKLTITPNFLIHNHLIGHKAISDKKNLLFNLRKFYWMQNVDPFRFLPESHEISTVDNDWFKGQNQKFVKGGNDMEMMRKQVWIVKPGEDSNRGRGIVVCKGWEEVVKEIQKRFKEEKSQKITQQQQNSTFPDPTAQHPNPTPHPAPRAIILQRYILPLLYHSRKFDIRSYMLLTYVNNILNCYVYDQCYIRTSSKIFDLQSQNRYVHLTNDAIQCMSHEYGKYEEGNKVGESVFARYFNQSKKNKEKNWDEIKLEMTERCVDIVKASARKLVGKYNHAHGHNISSMQSQKHSIEFGSQSLLLKPHSTSLSPESPKLSLFTSLTPSPAQELSFELFGLDFMIDEQSKLWLIQVNTNPAISHDCSRVLNRLIPKLIDNTFAIAVMPYMRPTKISESTQYHNQFRHVYQEEIKDE